MQIKIISFAVCFVRNQTKSIIVFKSWHIHKSVSNQGNVILLVQYTVQKVSVCCVLTKASRLQRLLQTFLWLFWEKKKREFKNKGNSKLFFHEVKQLNIFFIKLKKGNSKILRSLFWFIVWYTFLQTVCFIISFRD